MGLLESLSGATIMGFLNSLLRAELWAPKITLRGQLWAS